MLKELQDMLQNFNRCRLDRKVFSAGMADLKRMFAGQARGDLIKFDKLFIDGFYESVCHLPNELFMLAVQKVKQNYGKISGFPQPADIINAAQEILRDLAERQWHKLMDALSLKGSYVEKFVADKITLFILDRYFGGWVGFCNMLTSEQDWNKKLFVEKFVYHAMNPDTVEEIPFLEGLSTDGSVLELDRVAEEKRKLRERRWKMLEKQKQHQQIEAPAMSPEELREKAIELKKKLSAIGKPMPSVTQEDIEAEAARTN